MIDQAKAFAGHYLETMSATVAAERAGFSMSPVSPKKGFYVYLLIRPDTDQIVYVGKGVRRRMFSHMNDVMSDRISGLKKYQGLRDLVSLGVFPLANVLISSLTSEQAYELERILIRSIGRDRLLNSGGGTRNGDQIALQRLDDFRARLRPKEEWLRYAAMRTDLPEEYRSAEFYDKFVAEMDETRSIIVKTINEKMGDLAGQIVRVS